MTPVVRGQDEISGLLTMAAQLGSSISALVANVRSNAAFVAHAGQSLAAGNRELSDRTEQQAANLEQTAASVEDLSSNVQDNAHMAGQANTQAASARCCGAWGGGHEHGHHLGRSHSSHGQTHG